MAAFGQAHRFRHAAKPLLGLILCLVLSACFFSAQPLLRPYSEFPFPAAITNFKEQTLQEGAWRDSGHYQLRRAGQAIYVMIKEGPERERRVLLFEKLRPGFFAVMWKNTIAQPERRLNVGYYYELVYVDTTELYVYYWPMLEGRSLREHRFTPLGSACVARQSGADAVASSDQYVVSSRLTLLALMSRCIDQVIERRIAPRYRYVLQ